MFDIPAVACLLLLVAAGLAVTIRRRSIRHGAPDGIEPCDTDSSTDLSKTRHVPKELSTETVDRDTGTNKTSQDLTARPQLKYMKKRGVGEDAAPAPPTRKPPAGRLINDDLVDRMIAVFPKQTLEELRTQWLNLVRHEQASSPAAMRFRDALLLEWGRRTREARNPRDYFKWPSTRGGPGDGSLQFAAWHQEGMLRYLGYCVGVTGGESEAVRQRILDAVFSGSLPPVNDPDYVRGWGNPNTPARLQRLSNEIARFVRNAKNKKSSNMEFAIDEWEHDLEYLRKTYYIGRFRFAWP